VRLIDTIIVFILGLRPSDVLSEIKLQLFLFHESVTIRESLLTALHGRVEEGPAGVQIDIGASENSLDGLLTSKFLLGGLTHARDTTTSIVVVFYNDNAA
jgi:hypothetical protein